MHTENTHFPIRMAQIDYLEVSRPKIDEILFFLAWYNLKAAN